MRQYLIAESGGTKTDWCFVDRCKTKTYFTRKSYHPLNCTPKYLAEEKAFWDSHQYMLDAELLFYGSGCYREQGIKTLNEFLNLIGFRSVKVNSDLHAAGKALFAGEPGDVVILGTGSVKFHWNGIDVAELKGGKGFIDGDEGSGFYFGKLIYEAYVKGRLSSEQHKVLNSFIEWNDFDQSFSNQSHKQLFSELSHKLKDFRILFHDFHTENLKAFCEHCFNGKVDKNLSVIGSYGYYHQDIVKDVFRLYGVEVSEFLARPIDRLVEQTVLLDD